jgi:membrane protein DedA with SNARE-associated domain
MRAVPLRDAGERCDVGAMNRVVAAGGAGVASGGLPFVAALVAGMEAGVPIPIPADFVIMIVGERVAAGSFSLWAAVVALELAGIIGTTALFLAIRGPGHALIARFGPRFGLTGERIDRASGFLERRGRAAVVAGRATPGFRTVTVIAAGGSKLRPGPALALLVLGSSVFLQAHLLLGYFVGEAARDLLEAAAGWAVAAVALLVLAGIVIWLSRRGGSVGGRGWVEGSCPACLVAGMIATQAREEPGHLVSPKVDL